MRFIEDQERCLTGIQSGDLGTNGAPLGQTALGRRPSEGLGNGGVGINDAAG